MEKEAGLKQCLVQRYWYPEIDTFVHNSMSFCCEHHHSTLNLNLLKLKYYVVIAWVSYSYGI